MSILPNSTVVFFLFQPIGNKVPLAVDEVIRNFLGRKYAAVTQGAVTQDAYIKMDQQTHGTAQRGRNTFSIHNTAVQIRLIHVKNPLSVFQGGVMMKFTGVCLVTERVPVLVAFYTQILGCLADGDDTHAEFSIGGLSLAIFTRQGMEDMAPGSMQGAGCGSFTLGFEVEDVDAQYERLKALGVPFVKLPATYPWGARSVWFRDPDGNIVDLYSRVR